VNTKVGDGNIFGGAVAVFDGVNVGEGVNDGKIMGILVFVGEGVEVLGIIVTLGVGSDFVEDICASERFPNLAFVGVHAIGMLPVTIIIPKTHILHGLRNTLIQSIRKLYLWRSILSTPKTITLPGFIRIYRTSIGCSGI
jgi:hypothetical protein